MIILTKNDYINTGKCWYEDNYRNTFFMKRTDEGFTAKVRFANENVKAKPLEIMVPSNEEGQMLNINYLNGVEDNSIDVKEGITNFTELVQRWINMLLDILLLNANNDLLRARYNCDASDEELSQYKLEKLSEYEELANVIRNV